MDDQLLAGRNVLVVEDEMLVLMAIEDMLADMGCTSIAVAGTLENALDLVSSQRFDLAMLDINLNGERSYPVAEALTQKGIPFAFSTGYGEHGAGQGFTDCLVLNKPYNVRQLLSVITALLSYSNGSTPALTA